MSVGREYAIGPWKTGGTGRKLSRPRRCTSRVTKTWLKQWNRGPNFLLAE